LIFSFFSEEQEYIKTARFCGLAKQSRVLETNFNKEFKKDTRVSSQHIKSGWRQVQFEKLRNGGQLSTEKSPGTRSKSPNNFSIQPTLLLKIDQP